MVEEEKSDLRLKMCDLERHTRGQNSIVQLFVEKEKENEIERG